MLFLKFILTGLSITMYQKSLENKLSNKIIGAAIEVHKELGGPGLL